MDNTQGSFILSQLAAIAGVGEYHLVRRKR